MVRHVNKADQMVFKALQKAIAEDKVHLCLISAKVNIPGSPIYRPWECLLPILAPVLLGLILIWAVGILTGIALMTIGIILTSNLVKKKLESRLLERAVAMVTSDYNSCCELWDFGGLVLVKTDDKQKGCIAPEGDWKEFIIRYFSDLMVDRKETETQDNEHKKAA